ASYKALSGRGWKHHAINHAKGFYDKKGRSTNPIELYWATVRRYCRLYRQMNEANFWRYLGEIEFSYNRRKSNTSKFDEMVSFFPELTPENEAKIRARYIWD
ncbi:MAG: transposase, partial [Pseudomonadota bacterium]